MTLFKSGFFLAAIALGLGGVAAVGLAPGPSWFLSLSAFATMFFLLEEARSARAAAIHGWSFGAGYFGVSLVWIVEPFLVEPEIYGWMAPFALSFLAGGLALFWAAAFWLAYKCKGPHQVALIATLCGAELVRAYVFTGFPWAGISQIWVDLGPAQALSLLGPHGLTAVTLFFAWGAFWIWKRWTAPKQRILGCVIYLAFAITAVFGPRLSLPPPDLGDTTVRLVQPNAPQDQKWDPEMIPVFLDRKLDLTNAGVVPDLVVWPETSIPTLLEYADPILDDISVAARGAPVIAGVQRRKDKRLFNSAILLGDGDILDAYDKHHLVPFGEYVPFGNIAARFGLHGFAANEGQGFSAGPGPKLMDLGALGQALLLICYEAVFPQHARLAGERPSMLIQITNDAWFGTRSGPYQHLAQAQMRAVEQGLPMIRVANTGISAVIDPYGRVIGSIPLGQAGYLDVQLPVPLNRTLYSRTGDWPIFLLVIFALTLWRPRFERSGAK